jgi:hypothetical protein
MTLIHMLRAITSRENKLSVSPNSNLGARGVKCKGVRPSESRFIVTIKRNGRELNLISLSKD